MSSPAALVDRLLITRDFARLWAAAGVSSLGNTVYATTLVLWIATQLAGGRSWAPLAVSVLLIVRTVAEIALAPVAGVIVDRLPKRGLLVGMDLARAAVVAGLLAVAVADHGGNDTWLLGPVYAAVLIESACDAFFAPARMGMVQELVPAEQRGHAIGLQRSASSAAGLVGPPLAAPLLFGLGAEWGLALNAASFVASAALQGRITASGSPAPRAADAVHGMVAELLEGVRGIARSRVLRVITGDMAVISVASGLYGSLLVFFITDNLHAPATSYGVLGSVVSVGVICGSLVVGRVGRWLGVRRAVWVTNVLLGAVILVMSRMTAFGAALPLAFLVGIGEILGSVVLYPLILDATPPSMLGRVTGLAGTVTAAVTTASAFLGGALASSVLAHLDTTVAGIHLGTYDTLFGVSGLIVLAGAVWARIGLGPDPAPARLAEATAPPAAS